jgi:ABC-2 type transport system ATP-binding protein
MVVIDHGKVITRGTGDELKAQVGGQRLEFVVADAKDLPALSMLLEPLAIDAPQIDEQSRTISLPVTGGADDLAAALQKRQGSGIELMDVGLRRPDLDDVFLILTGHGAGS